MARKITDTLVDDLHRKTDSQLNEFLDEADALLTAGNALSGDSRPQSQQRLGSLLDRAATALAASSDGVPRRPNPTVEKAKRLVKEHPIKSAVVLLGVALIARRVLSRR